MLWRRCRTPGPRDDTEEPLDRTNDRAELLATLRIAAGAIERPGVVAFGILLNVVRRRDAIPRGQYDVIRVLNFALEPHGSPQSHEFPCRDAAQDFTQVFDCEQ